MKSLIALLSLAMLCDVGASSPAAAQFFYDPHGPPLVYYTERQAWPQPVIRLPDGRRVAVPAWSAQGEQHRDEPPVPASQYSLN
ncbi:hypothetical protein [Lichenifustis flavocetrariae]|uniref:Uncharacterized protein n=1 Tax=Lichenifustis flavocetrariae TaxID=2949735 RepID=A0AA41YZK8_9HYPH|nr:hypothetical protein [Lichenifustis flavocetrariae]MCW6511034.1 hypothetical protein [Lichenifustis flavocetrariae]